MSNEENLQNEEKINKTCKYTMFIVLTIISLLFSITALTLTILSLKGGIKINEPKPVVISQQYDKGKSLDKALATKKPMIVFFYTDWCGFCQRFVPTFDKVSKDSKIKKKFAIAYVNCEEPKNRQYVEDYKVEGFPTVYVVTTEGKRVHLDNNTFFNDNSKTVIIDNALEVIKENKDADKKDEDKKEEKED